MAAHQPVERRTDLGVAQVDLGEFEVGFGLQIGGCRFVDCSLRGRVFLEQGFLTAEFNLGLVKDGLRQVDLLLVLILLDDEQQFVLLDVRAVIKKDLGQVARNARIKIDLKQRVDVAIEEIVTADIL